MLNNNIELWNSICISKIENIFFEMVQFVNSIEMVYQSDYIGLKFVFCACY